MKLLIDGDGCPVVDLTLSIADEYRLEAWIFCDTAHVINKESAKTVTVAKGADSVDFALLKEVEKGDIVITQDYGLASMVLVKGGQAIRQDGLVYTIDNIDNLLAERHRSRLLRKEKVRVKGPGKRMADDNIKFSTALKGILGN